MIDSARSSFAAAQTVAPEALAHSRRLALRIAEEIDRAGGWITFDRYMQLALYEAGLGYYAAKPGKIGPEGDFVTAPEISPLFARALAAQVAEVFERMRIARRVLEFGAGSGALAGDLIRELARLGAAPESYGIVEVSPDLRAEQQARLGGAVKWLDVPPEEFEGVVIANEVLDVMPAKLFARRGGRILEQGVEVEGEELRIGERPASFELREAVEQIEADSGPLPEGYVSEVGLIARAWTATLGRWLRRGVALLIDYGFPRHEYYHPQRAMGTLMCHFRHQAHAKPLWLPGLNDITAHIDFTAIARAANDAGLDLLGYTSQARFLLDCGILDLLRQSALGARETADALRLLSEAEMGELLKVLAVGRGIGGPLLGFRSGDRLHRL
ncbi:MAG: SAM-dependent methyltransferase [Hyphomicrobiales bacterium]|nr:SAM-dependent methyltransferase [Hyphomicrobiales bacterium]